MVFTDPVDIPPHVIRRTGAPRRTVLRAAVATGAALMSAPTVGGCGLLDRGGPDQPPPPDPLLPLRDSALALGSQHRRAAAAHPELAQRLAPLAEAHAAH